MALPLNSSMTVIDIINKSNEVDPDLIASYMHNRAVNEPAYSLLIFMYSLLILTGASGNSLVVSIFNFFMPVVSDYSEFYAVIFSGLRP